MVPTGRDIGLKGTTPHETQTWSSHQPPTHAEAPGLLLTGGSLSLPLLALLPLSPLSSPVRKRAKADFVVSTEIA